MIPHHHQLIHKNFYFHFPSNFPFHRHEWKDGLCDEAKSFFRSRYGDDIVGEHGKLLTCLINGSRVRSIDFVFTSCSSLDGFLQSSKWPAIAFRSIKHLNYTINSPTFSLESRGKFFLFSAAINSRKEFSFLPLLGRKKCINRAKNTSEVNVWREKFNNINFSRGKTLHMC